MQARWHVQNVLWYEPLCADDNRKSGRDNANAKAYIYVDDDNSEVSNEEHELENKVYDRR